MNDKLKTKLNTLPLSPGVYFHKDVNDEIIYVGKAAVLRNRVRQYFQDSRGRDNKTMALVAEIADTDWIETESEVDALFLESEMVKRYMPRYNVLLRDDKSQSFVRIDMKSEWPTVTFTRNPLDDGAEYIGPFYNAFALKKALRYLRKIFPYLTKERHPGQSRLDEDLGISPKISEGSEVYKADLRRLISYIKGNRVALIRELEQDMKRFSQDQQFEKATVIRNQLRYMRELQRRVMFGDREFMDISKDRALSDLRGLFGLKREPARIEGYDVSHLSGTHVVASMVVFTNGVSSRAEYRKFKMTNQRNDDTGNIYETIFRRFSEKNQKSWGVPDLILIDGGKGQLEAAIRALQERDVRVPIVSIAKRIEEIVVHQTNSFVNVAKLRERADVSVREEGSFVIVNLHPGQTKSHGHALNLRGDGANYTYDDVTRLFQRIRDESHRFAISYHMVLRKTEQTKNTLEEIPGIGPKTRAKLLKKFGSLAGVKAATTQELSIIIGETRAQAVRQFLDT